MKKLTLLSSLIGLSLMISGCGERTETSPYIKEEKITKTSYNKKATQQNERFKVALTREYNIISERLATYKDYTNSTYFRRKARDVGYGMFDVLPERPQKWRIRNEVTLDKLYNTRVDLVNKLSNSKLIIAAPISAAKAQAYYDCWVEQSQNTFRSYDFSCKDNFISVNRYLDEVETEIRLNKEFNETQNIQDKSDNLKYEAKPAYAGSYSDEQKKAELDKAAKKSAASAKPAQKKNDDKKSSTSTGQSSVASNADRATVDNTAPKIVVDETSNQPDVAYIIYFDSKQEKSKETSTAELDKAVASIKANSVKAISINGHTDKADNDSNSMLLSKKRADNVKDQLVAKGVDKNIIRTYGFGKTDNTSTSADGQNRVEITFKEKK